MKKIFSVTLSAVLAASFAFSAPQVYAANADSKAGIIETAGGNLNVRSAASSGSEIRTSLKKGSYVTLISKSGDWWKVEYSDGKFGFCHSDYITVVSDDTAMVSTKSGNLNVRSGAERIALNTPIQGTAADLIKLAMIRVEEALHTNFPEAKLLLQVHDELIVECPEELAPQVAELISREMQSVAQLKVPLTAEAKYGKSWYDAK